MGERTGRLADLLPGDRQCTEGDGTMNSTVWFRCRVTPDVRPEAMWFYFELPAEQAYRPPRRGERGLVCFRARVEKIAREVLMAPRELDLEPAPAVPGGLKQMADKRGGVTVFYEGIANLPAQQEWKAGSHLCCCGCAREKHDELGCISCGCQGFALDRHARRLA